MPVTSEPQSPTRVQTLEYPRAAPLNRRHFRLLLALTLLNTFLIVGGFVFAPLVQSTTGQFWQDFQRKRAQQSAQKQFLARYRQCAAFAQPPATVVYDEDPHRAAKLYAGGGYRRLDSHGGGYSYIVPRPWQIPVLTAPPAVAVQMSNLRAAPGTIFLHGLRTPSGKERLVEVHFDGMQQMRGYGNETQRNFTITPERTIEAGVFELNRIVVSELSHTQLRFNHDGHEGPIQIIWTKGDTWEQGKVEFMPKNMLRIFAGQPDVADPSHFTISYDIDGKPGVIDGRLNNDDTLTLQPRQGRVVNRNSSGTAIVWDFDPQPPGAASTK